MAATTIQTTNDNDAADKPPRQMTAPEAIGKINKILKQLSAGDQKRVMAFFNATTE